MLDIPPLDPGIEIVVASRGMSKGVAQTDGPQLAARPFAQLGPLQLGAQWKNFSSAVADGEATLSIGASPKLGQFRFALGVSYKFLTSVREPTDDHGLEYSASVARKFDKLSLRLAAVYSPNDLGRAKRSLFIETGPAFELDKSTRLFAAIGRRKRVDGDDYTAFNAGLAKTLFKGAALEVKWHDTDRSSLGSPYKGRLVVSTRMAL